MSATTILIIAGVLVSIWIGVKVLRITLGLLIAALIAIACLAGIGFIIGVQ